MKLLKLVLAASIVFGALENVTASCATKADCLPGQKCVDGKCMPHKLISHFDSLDTERARAMVGRSIPSHSADHNVNYSPNSPPKIRAYEGRLIRSPGVEARVQGEAGDYRSDPRRLAILDLLSSQKYESFK